MKKLLLGLIAIIALASCQKRKDIHGDLKDREQILTSRNWRIVSIKDNSVPQNIKPCERDNYFVFETGGVGRWEEGTDNCFDTVTIDPDPNDSTFNQEPGIVPTYTSFDWSMIGNLTFIYIKNFGTEGYDPEWEVVNMDYSSMRVHYSEMIDGYNHRYEMELVAL